MRFTLLAVCLAVAGCAGSDGRDGLNGAPGIGLVTETLCTVNDATHDVILTHNVYDFADGSVMATCESGFLSNSPGSYSSVSMFKSNETGAATGACLVRADSTGASTSGYWTFDLSGSVSVATYHDSVDGTYTINVPCSVN